MFERRSLKWPITLGVILFVLLVALTVGWVLLTLFWRYWTLLTVGSLSLVLVIVGVALYLALSVKEINLNRRQSNFMDSVTHELKSPIASLKLYLQTMHRRTVTAEEQKMFFRYMLEDVERLDRLINHLLEAARLDREDMTSEIVEIELGSLLRQCVEEVQQRYDGSANAIELRIEPSVVRARRVDLDMIFRNLIDNAVKYAGTPPRVQVTSEPRPDGTVVTRVIDNGGGIPSRFRNKVFGRFVRLGSELERKKPGTGLGLYIVHTLINRLRGKVRVRDGEAGVGTVFEVVLPGWTLEKPLPAPAPPKPEQHVA